MQIDRGLVRNLLLSISDGFWSLEGVACITCSDLMPKNTGRLSESPTAAYGRGSLDSGWSQLEEEALPPVEIDGIGIVPAQVLRIRPRGVALAIRPDEAQQQLSIIGDL